MVELINNVVYWHADEWNTNCWALYCVSTKHLFYFLQDKSLCVFYFALRRNTEESELIELPKK